jgi:hypothetical protein
MATRRRLVKTRKKTAKPKARPPRPNDIDEQTIQRYLNKPNYILLTDLPTFKQKRLLQKYRDTLTDPLAVQIFETNLKAGVPFFYNEATQQVIMPIPEQKVDADGFSKISINADLASTTGLDAGAQVFLSSMRAPLTIAEINQAKKEAAAERAAEKLISEEKRKEREEEDLKNWYALLNDDSIKVRLEQERTKADRADKLFTEATKGMRK